MPSLNKVQLIGNLGRDPEVRFTPDTQERVVSFSLAVNRRKRNENGRQAQETDWFTIEAWGRVAEVCQQYLCKGALVYVEGALKTGKYESDGEMRFFTKVVARDVQRLLQNAPVEIYETPV